MSKANYSLRLQPSLKVAAEKLSALETEEFFRARAAAGSRDDFLAFLDGAGDEEPCGGDNLLDS
ncbi:hypothetical protein GGE65_001758 [Skermanella aerolata]|uniref:hypothetical protein n=1 Tax=Skermanella aerolata TaxID=393310 RepID=UPI003D23C59D